MKYNLVNQKFGRLTVLKETGRTPGRKCYWNVNVIVVAMLLFGHRTLKMVTQRVMDVIKKINQFSCCFYFTQ